VRYFTLLGFPLFLLGTPARYSYPRGLDASTLVGSFFGCGVFICCPTVGIIGSTCVGIVEPFSVSATVFAREPSSRLTDETIAE
jgi:hypothetical protein